MLRFNRETLRDKIHACWMGKNIGGTMGAPFEGCRDILDVQGFTTEEGVILPNDDLDLQLIWLKALEDVGPNALDEKILGEYWLSYILPSWNEYGIGKANMRAGLFPPLSGEAFNAEWKHSNGAWIRSEIWACLYPGCPERAIRFAYCDACVDHGHSEGTFGEIFTAALESAAFVINDINLLLDIGLSKIPAECLLAKCVQHVRQAHAQGQPWQSVRQDLIAMSSEIGFFQAPANIAFIVIGLLYGEGDFKKSMLTALNCGDDTDCTGATIGALMGIMHGTAGIPENWKQHIGDKIETMCILKGHGEYPHSCSELTDCILDMLPVTLKVPFFVKRKEERPADFIRQHAMVWDQPDDFRELDVNDYFGRTFSDSIAARSGYSFTARNIFAEAIVEFDHDPVLDAANQIRGRLTIKLKRFPEQKHFQLRWLMPEFWTVESKLNLMAGAEFSLHQSNAKTEFVITANSPSARNRVVLEVDCIGRTTPIYIPFMILK